MPRSGLFTCTKDYSFIHIFFISNKLLTVAEYLCYCALEECHLRVANLLVVLFVIITQVLFFTHNLKFDEPKEKDF